jgi:hypothetical protein
MIARYHPKQNRAVEAPKRKYGGHVRLIGRSALLRALASEYQFGDSHSRLYVAMLVRSMLRQEPKLAERLPYYVEECGVVLKRAEDTTVR